MPYKNRSVKVGIAEAVDAAVDAVGREKGRKLARMREAARRENRLVIIEKRRLLFPANLNSPMKLLIQVMHPQNSRIF